MNARRRPVGTDWMQHGPGPCNWAMAPEAIRHETSGDDQPPDSDRADARTETIQAGMTGRLLVE